LTGNYLKMQNNTIEKLSV